MSYKLENLLSLMQNPHLFPTKLIITVDNHGLLYGAVETNDIEVLFSSKKQFIQELLEELDDDASVFIERITKR